MILWRPDGAPLGLWSLGALARAYRQARRGALLGVPAASGALRQTAGEPEVLRFTSYSHVHDQ